MKQAAERGRRFTTADPLEALKQAREVKDLGERDPVITWEGNDQARASLACLDIDYHARPLDDRPDADILTTFALSIPFAPELY